MADGPLGKVAADLRGFLEKLPDLSGLDQRLAEVRALLVGEEPVLGEADGIELGERHAGRPDGSQLRLLVHRPTSHGQTGKLPALIHVHGGGYVSGSANRDEAEARQTANEIGCVVISPDYRLAPENPYPDPLDDILLAHDWLTKNAESLNVDLSRVAIRGNSAGGGLALAAAMKLREKPETAPCFLLLVYPMLDDRTIAHEHNGVYVWTPENNRFGWDAYLARVDRSDPPALAVPGRTDDVAGLPPVFLVTGAIDLFAGENLDFARKLVDAGVPLEMHVYPGAYHGFTLVPCAASRAYKTESFRALSEAFGNANQGD